MDTVKEECIKQSKKLRATPLRPARDACVVDTSRLDIQGVL